MFRKIIKFLIVIALTVSAVYGVKWYLSYKKSYTGRQWFDRQETYVKQFKTYSKGVDSVVTLYTTNRITQDAYASHMNTFKDELLIMSRKYKQDKAEHPVRTGTYTYLTKKGCESVEKVYTHMDNLLNVISTYDNYRHTGKLAYKFLAMQQPIIDDMSNYYSCKDMIKEGDE